LHISDPWIAIHEIFAQNAASFPDEECVIVTKSVGQSISFTYREINESSNQLAHHLIDHGCEVGNVVMIYAYRG
jgi:L-2-aminoadipate reductase